MDVPAVFVPSISVPCLSSVRGARSRTVQRAPTSISSHKSHVSGVTTSTVGIILASVVIQTRRAKRICRKSQLAKIGSRAFEQELGVTLPVGYWDPMGLSADGDEEAFRRRRISEIKNGRVAMIASLGYIIPEYIRWPGEISPSLSLKFQNIPSGLAALYKIPAEGWAQMGTFVAFLELFPMRQELHRAPGDYPTCGKYGIPWFFVGGKHRQTYSVDENMDSYRMDPMVNQRSLNAEINNGRLAMWSIAGMVAQNAFLGTTGPDMWIP